MDSLTLATDDATSSLKTVLHVGCGMADPAKLPTDAFPAESWRELRLDIDASVMPDIVASITDMQALSEGAVDAVWSSHNLEHLRAHEVPLALSEFFRVLRPGGFALMTMPDLQRVAALVAQGLLEEPAYISSAGPIAPIDILYGYRPSIEGGNDFMAHRTGFTVGSLSAHLIRTGFVDVQVESDGRFALWARGVRPA
ncbi:SAM-dependent methyltransferase [Rhodovulum sulfidophilum]|uniref:class I SAM-dependent methyltransferase n=1 Tax=Rhodovulum sulfidophilum TaxID=35806 RepID=UPI0005A96553|nr:methyltransferase domain-containing protein [Rhodovulum sulfidophilum]ANB35639.1 SAM-dependent methyltransferase [Rhodovulum sulfidophilum DSM 1374]ANB39461.1 SAM-dependent methyltransferase [Rhodovulum sulfidophilum]MCW2302741.1 SAM-dependent methyltransferase [Rhodovulum sulfidophilum]